MCMHRYEWSDFNSNKTLARITGDVDIHNKDCTGNISDIRLVLE